MAGVLPSSFWNPRTVEQTELVDIVDGSTQHISIAAGGTEPLEIGGRRVEARHYQMRGDIDRDLWYGLDGQLLKIEFEAEDGSRITQLRKSL
jgi:hypothetical protein